MDTYIVDIYYQDKWKVKQPYVVPIPTPKTWTGYCWIELIINSNLTLDNLIEDYTRTHAYYNYLNKKYKTDADDIYFKSKKDIEWEISIIKSTYNDIKQHKIILNKF